MHTELLNCRDIIKLMYFFRCKKLFAVILFCCMLVPNVSSASIFTDTAGDVLDFYKPLVADTLDYPVMFLDSVVSVGRFFMTSQVSVLESTGDKISDSVSFVSDTLSKTPTKSLASVGSIFNTLIDKLSTPLVPIFEQSKNSTPETNKPKKPTVSVSGTQSSVSNTPISQPLKTASQTVVSERVIERPYTLDYITQISNLRQELLTVNASSVSYLKDLMGRQEYKTANNVTNNINNITTGGSGTLTSVDASGGTTGLTFSGGPITTSGTLTLGGTLAISNGGTGTTTAPSYGQILLGNSSGGYDLVATSSLGIVGSSGDSLWTSESDDIYFIGGRVGVGTTTPGADLDVSGEGSGNYLAGYGSVLAVNTTDGTNWALNIRREDLGSDSDIALYNGGDSSGGMWAFAVGDGEGNYVYPLEMDKYVTTAYRNETSNIMAFSGLGNNIGFILNPAYNKWSLGYGSSRTVAATPALTWDASGNVGIGTTSPAYKLEVNGDLNFTGNLYQDGVLFTSGGGSGAVSANSDNAIWSSNTTEPTNIDVIALGNHAGDGITGTGAQKSNFIGYYAGNQATNAYNSNFIGVNAGDGATNADKSNFIGHRAGNGATNAYRANFIGRYAGYSATNAHDSNFIGQQAGYNATNASISNFIGVNAGYGATDSSNSSFIGNNAGYGATDSPNSNFFGSSAGYNATDVTNSVFLGSNAGYYASNASNSVFIGNGAGANDVVNNNSQEGWSVLIGNNIHTGGYSNSILIGGTFGGPVSNTAANQFMISSSVTDFNFVGVNYKFPTLQGGAGQVLTNDGSGVLTWEDTGTGSSQWTTNGSDVYFDGGNVGIGTTNTANALTLNKAGATIGIADNSEYNSTGGSLTITGGTGTAGANTGGDLILKGGNSYTGEPHEAGDVMIYGGVNNFNSPTYGGAIRLYTSSAERLTVLNDGNVGIKNSSPAYTLDVDGNINFTGTLYQNGVAFSGGGAGGDGAPGGSDGQIQFNSNGSFSGFGSWNGSTFNLGGGDLSIADGNFTVNSSGNITRLNGVTISFPASQGTADQILANDGSGSLYWTNNSGATGPQGPEGPAGANGSDGVNGTDGAQGAEGAQGPAGPDGAQGPQGEPGSCTGCEYYQTIFDHGTNLMAKQYINFTGDGVSITNEEAGVIVQVPGSNWITSGSDIYRSSGNVGIGIDSPAYKLHVGGSIFAADDICSNGGTYCLASFSDQRLKKDVVSFSSGTLDKILTLNPVSYKWNDTYLNEHKGSVGATDTKFGFIAQELDIVFPEVVVHPVTPGGYLGVDYSKLTAVLTQGIKELYAMVDDIKSKLDSVLAWFSNGNLNIQNDVCVDDVCVTKEEFKQMLLNTKGNSDSGSPSAHSGPNTESNTNSNELDTGSVQGGDTGISDEVITTEGDTEQILTTTTITSDSGDGQPDTSAGPASEPSAPEIDTESAPESVNNVQDADVEPTEDSVQVAPETAN
jgi:hypothetical protein